MPAPRGRRRAQLELQDILHYLNLNMKIRQVATILQVSSKTIRRRLQEAGESFRHHLDDDDLLHEIEAAAHITAEGRGSGFRVIQSSLMAHGIRAPRAQILSVLRQHDANGMAARRERVIPRQQYTLRKAMLLWHIDSYEKLKPFGFTVHGGIDGGSNFIVYVTLALNKQTESIFMGYRAAVEMYGRPGRIRADMAFEALAVGQDMIDHRGPGSYLTGSSVHNQRIECWWNFLWSHWAYYWKQQFQVLQEHGVLDRTNPVHLFSLVAAYFDIMQKRLTEIAHSWNLHSIRPQRRYSIQAYVPAHRFHEAMAEGARLQLDEVDNLQGVIDAVDFQQFLPNEHTWSNANDREEARLQTPNATDLLQDPLDKDVRDSVYRQLKSETQHSDNYLLHRLISEQVQARPIWQHSAESVSVGVLRVRRWIVHGFNHAGTN